MVSVVGIPAALAAPGDLTLVSTSSTGEKASGGNGSARSVSADGTKVAFISSATNLDPAATDGTSQVYVKDLSTGEVTLASVSNAGEAGNQFSWFATLSADGTKVAFVSFANNLSPADFAFDYDVYVKDLVSGRLTLASARADGTKGDSWSFPASFSADGSKLAFISISHNLDRNYSGLDNGQVYLKDLVTGDVTLVSTSESGEPANDLGAELFDPPILSADGSKFSFTAESTNLDPAVTAPYDRQIFVKDLSTGDVSLVSSSSTGTKANNYGGPGTLSADGNWVAFPSNATNLDPASTDGRTQMYVKNLESGELTLASVSDTGHVANDSGVTPYEQSDLSADGTRIAFLAGASNLVPSASVPSVAQIYVKDLSSGDVTLASSSFSGVAADDLNFGPSLSGDGTKVAFTSFANLDPADTDGVGDVYLKDLGPVPPACTISGTGEADVLQGTSGPDVICGFSGNDNLRGVGGNDVIFGGPGFDAVSGGAGSDEVHGGGSKDTVRTLDGIGGNDTADGGSGNDICKVDIGDVVISC
jgi:Tol biopolymer transport system component